MLFENKRIRDAEIYRSTKINQCNILIMPNHMVIFI